MAKSTEYRQWLRDVNRAIARITHGEVTSIMELPDYTYADAFESGASPEDAAAEALLEAGFPEDLLEDLL